MEGEWIGLNGWDLEIVLENDLGVKIVQSLCLRPHLEVMRIKRFQEYLVGHKLSKP